MIHSISCKNFYSLGEENTLSFVVNDNAPKNNSYFTTPLGTRLSKVETIIGPNASGKTNLLKVIPFLKWLIVDSFEMNPQQALPINCFALNEHKSLPTEISVVFEIERGVYTYSFTLNKNKITSEDLRLVSMANEKKSNKKMFSRSWNEGINSYELDDANFDLPKGSETLLRSNASVVAVAIRLNHKESQDIANYWQKLETNVGPVGWVGGHGIHNTIQQAMAFKFYSENDKLKKAAEKMLSRFDLGLNAFEIEKSKNPNDFLMNVSVSHSFGDEKVNLPFDQESSGTKQLFVLLKHILVALEKGGIAVLDEFDVSLHPDMMLALFDMFIEPELNPKNAQLLFSTHSHQILSKLDKYQIILIEKNSKGMSESWRLDEMEGVRADDNYYTKYLAGAYGAVPKI
ncbi:MAG: ATP-binding protein [Candidatus Taylorbacteria bacterium]|nr:ATP-binding protein [Candidatus Taylorbacteria bacterium]